MCRYSSLCIASLTIYSGQQPLKYGPKLYLNPPLKPATINKYLKELILQFSDYLQYTHYQGHIDL